MPARSVDQLVEALKAFKPGAPLKHYITHARFPNFKGLERDSRIDFSFPFTALVGPNGIGKSSVLHALQGMPEGGSTAKFWFATALDPIESKIMNPPRYIYGHWHESFAGVVETRKARVFSKARNYEYWEPTKATLRDKMEKMPAKAFARKDADRWNAVEREVIYLNMKVVIGAFDRTFNFGLSMDQLTAKQGEMRAGARLLRSAVDRQVQSWRLGGGRERVFENRLLTAIELGHVSEILGRAYSSARYIRHSLYPEQKGSDASVIFERGFKYSEAFAGSGEVSVVTAVVRILNASKYALIVLDEPETSLHPGAQRALLGFLLEQILKKQLQIVISTHSTDFLQGLPDNAVKVFEDNGQGKSRVLNECSPYVAFNRLGKPAANKKRIYVEDLLAKIVVEQAAKALHQGEREALEIAVAQGGADGILANQIPVHMVAQSDCFVLLDGDKMCKPVFTDPATISPREYEKLDALIKEEVGTTPKFALNGGNDTVGIAHDKVAKQLHYLEWIRMRLGYLPRQCPDAILLGLAAEGDNKRESDYFKSKLYNAIGNEQTPEGYLGVAKYLASQLPDDNADLIAIRDILKAWLSLPPAG